MMTYLWYISSNQLSSLFLKLVQIVTTAKQQYFLSIRKDQFSQAISCEAISVILEIHSMDLQDIYLASQNIYLARYPSCNPSTDLFLIQMVEREYSMPSKNSVSWVAFNKKSEF